METKRNGMKEIEIEKQKKKLKNRKRNGKKIE